MLVIKREKWSKTEEQNIWIIIILGERLWLIANNRMIL